MSVKPLTDTQVEDLRNGSLSPKGAVPYAIARIEQDAETIAKLEIDLDEADTDRRALEAEAATLRAERDELREALEWWLVLHNEDQNDADVLRTLAGDKEGQPWDHLRAIACDIEAARDIFRQALGSGGAATGNGAEGEVERLAPLCDAPGATTPAPAGAKESDDDE